MNFDLNLPPKDMEPLTHSTQPPTETPSPDSNQPDSNQQNDQHASQPESVASVSQYFAPIQAEFDEECDNFGKHVRQDCDKFTSIQEEIIEFSLTLKDQLLTNSNLQQQFSQAKEGKTAQLSEYGLEMTATENATDTMKSKLHTLKNEIRRHCNEQTELRCQGAKKEAEEYEKQHIIPLELQRDQLAKDIERLESTDLQVDTINQEIDKNSKNIQELENTLKKLMRELKLRARASYLDNINDVLPLKAEIVNLNQVILKMRDELIQKDADIVAVREDMKAEMKELADHCTVQMEDKDAEIIALHDEIHQQSRQLRNQFQAQFPSSVTPNSTEELLHLITAPQGSLMLVSLTSLDLSKCKLGDMKTAFFKALLKMPNLVSLNLNGSAIGDAGVQALATSKTFTNLTSLDLGSNNIGDAGVEALAASTTLTNLTSLDLGSNKIGDAGIQALVVSTTFTKLTFLDLYDNEIGDAGAKALAASSSTNLASLKLGYNWIGDDGIKALVTSTILINLPSLDLDRNCIGDAGVQALAASTRLTNLTSLDLTLNDVGDNGVQALAASKTLINLASLKLRHNKIGDDGAKALTASTTLINLTSLNLEENKIGRDAAKALKKKYLFACLD